MTVRDRVTALLDAIPEQDLPTLERMLRGLVAAGQDPFLVALAAAPEDSEPESEEERGAVARAWEAAGRGETTSHDEVVRRAKASR